MELIPKLQRLALNMRARGVVDQDDMSQAAALALMRSREIFDPKRGLKWSTYALNRARGAMLDALRDIDHIPRLQRHRLKVAGLEGEKILSIDRQAMDVSREGMRGIFETTAECSDFWHRIRQRLGERLGGILEKYFREDRTLKAIGQSIGLSESRCCQLLERGLRALRQQGFGG